MLTISHGWEPRQTAGCNLFQFSAIRRTTRPLRFVPLIENCLRYGGLYRRPHEYRDGQLWCPISGSPMSTSFANLRFLVPWLADGGGWVLFCDGVDMLFLDDPAKLFAMADDRYAVMVVKHQHEPTEATKMDDQIQTKYKKKNWSSVILWNLDHSANQRLTIEMVNELPGRDLHRFCWLEDDEIGGLPETWNFLVGIDPRGGESVGDAKPALLHYTLGSPELGYRGPWAQEWMAELAIMDASRKKIRA